MFQIVWKAGFVNSDVGYLVKEVSKLGVKGAAVCLFFFFSLLLTVKCVREN